MVLHARQAGDASAPAIVLLHGAGRASGMWRPAIRNLSASWQVLAPDLPGFGLSPGPFTVSGATEAVGDLIAGQSRPVHLCGLSLGGIVAVRVAAQFRSQVASLVVTGTPVAPARDFPATLRTYRWLPEPLLRAFSDVIGRREWLQMIGELEGTDLSSCLDLVTARTLVICGSRDRRSLPAARELAAGIADGRLWVAPQQGHSWPVRSPGLFSTVVSGFIAGR